MKINQSLVVNIFMPNMKNFHNELLRYCVHDMGQEYFTHTKNSPEVDFLVLL